MKVRLSNRRRSQVPRLTILGTPVHPPLTDLPVGLFCIAPVFDGVALATGSTQLAGAGFWSEVAGSASSIPTAATGALDYLRVPANAEGKQRGTTHGLLNVLALGLAVGSAWRRRKSPDRPDAIGLCLTTACAIAIVTSGHLGGQLVYERGFRVERARPLR
jgi:uncharacterized membrane protein